MGSAASELRNLVLTEDFDMRQYVNGSKVGHLALFVTHNGRIWHGPFNAVLTLGRMERSH